jgi:hypothetical protein
LRRPDCGRHGRWWAAIGAGAVGGGNPLPAAELLVDPARGMYWLATDITFEGMPGTTRILLRPNPSNDTFAVYAAETHTKSGTNLLATDSSTDSSIPVRTGPGANSVTCTPELRSSPRNDSLKVFRNALVEA